MRCDASKPLQANIGNLTGDENDPGIRRARNSHSSGERLGWRLLEPVAFGDSRDHAAIQLADVIAGAMVAIVTNDFPPEFRTVGEMMMRHVHPHMLMPDMEIINRSNRSAAVNAVIVYELAKRAERQADPHEGLAEMYHQAELAWVQGDFKRFNRTRAETGALGRRISDFGFNKRASADG